MKLYLFLTTSLFLLLFESQFLLAQKKNRKDSPEKNKKSEIRYEGYFNFSFDSLKDRIFLEVNRLNEEFLYVNALAAGVGSNDIGLDRGQLGNSRIVRFEKHGKKLLLTQPNYSYRAITDNKEELKSVQEAFAQSVLWGFNILSEENGSYVIDLSDFLLRDAHNVSGRLKDTGQGNFRLDQTKSALFLERTRSFPENSEFESSLTFTGNADGEWVRSVTPTPSNITVRQHHSFIQLPDSNYKVRRFDPRAGYYLGTSYQDYATPINESLVKRFISRHRLEKKNPEARISEAVEPIVYYLDRGAPEPIRSALIDGARWWNQAFEAAGYKDAFQVKLLPEDADPLDVRYNVIQWVHRSTRGWSYGASVRDPRTGEIIKGHVSLGSLRVRQDFLIAEGLLAPYEDDQDISSEMEELALARLRQLSAHEVGHTLGLAHSYSSSTEGRASVMDYPHPLVKVNNGKIDISDAYDQKIGSWDKVAIAYGYQDFPENVGEEIELNRIIQEGLSKGLTFISDQDARPLGGAHPHAHLWDNGKNIIDGLKEALEVRRTALKNFGLNNIPENRTLAELEEVLVPVYFYHRYQTEAVAKLVGGIDYRYAIKGDGQFATKMLDSKVQKDALEILIKTIAAETLELPESILEIIPPRPIGYNRGRELVKVKTSLTFDWLSAAESTADKSLSLLFHPSRMQRLVLHHARDNSQPSLEYVIDRVLAETVLENPGDGVKGEIQRMVNELVIKNLIAIELDNHTSETVKSLISYKLKNLGGQLDKFSRASSNIIIKAHYSHLKSHIESYEKNPEKYEKPRSLTLPDGSPIGNSIRCDY